MLIKKFLFQRRMQTREQREKLERLRQRGNEGWRSARLCIPMRESTPDEGGQSDAKSLDKK